MTICRPDEFKAAMRHLAATVSLVTTVEDVRRYGMPATAVTSLSADPPSLLVCINRSASMHAPTMRNRLFCVNLLSGEQGRLCAQFGAREGPDRFAVGEWHEGPYGLPYVAGAAATLFCRAEDHHDFGTHTIFIGRIEQALSDSAAGPLIFQAGAMGTFAATPAPAGSI